MRTEFPIFFITLFFSLFVFSDLVLAQFATADVWGGTKSWFANTLGVPEDWIEWPNVFWLIMLPYIATLAIIFGLLEEIRIFRHAEHKMIIYLIIAAGWAMFLIPTGFLGTVASVFYTIGAALSVIIFSLMFIFGVFIWAYVFLTTKRMESTYSSQLFEKRRHYEEELNRIRSKINKILGPTGTPMTSTKMTQLSIWKNHERKCLDELKKIKEALETI